MISAIFFFYLSKIMNALLNPMLWMVVLLSLAWILKNQRKKKILSLISLGLALLSSNAFLMTELARTWEVKPLAETSMAADYDVGIVLGGGMVQEDKTTGRIIFRENSDRLLQAIRLYKTHTVAKLLISGGSGQIIDRSMLEASLIRKYLLTIGIPASDLLSDTLSVNTHENAVNSAAILKSCCPRGKFLLITSAMHMRRAYACFRKEGISCTPFPTNNIAGTRHYDLPYLILPRSKALNWLESYLHEVLGQFTYKIMGYV